MGKKTVITLTITVVIFIIALWTLMVIYNTAREQYLDGHKDSQKLAMQIGQITSIESIETFYGDIKYHVITGENIKEEKVYIWIPQSEKKNVIIKKHSAGITKEQAIKEVHKEYDPIKIIDVKLGMDEGIPLWEIKYKDRSNRYTFDLVNFYDGEIIKHMAINLKD